MPEAEQPARRCMPLTLHTSFTRYFAEKADPVDIRRRFGGIRGGDTIGPARPRRFKARADCREATKVTQLADIM